MICPNCGVKAPTGGHPLLVCEAPKETRPAPTDIVPTSVQPVTGNRQGVVLALCDRARYALEEAVTIPETKDVRDSLESAIEHAKRQRDITLETINYGAELKLRAERQLGRLIPETVQRGGDQRPEAKSHDVTLHQMGINNMQSSRWQLEATVPDEVFSKYVRETNDAGEEITSAGLQRVARQIQAPPVIDHKLAIPMGQYSCLVVDPPWPVVKIDRDERPLQGPHLDYPVMTLEEIEELNVGDLSFDNCHLYLWVTQKFLPFGLSLIETWGFRYQCVMTWVKPSGFTPFSWMYNTEHCLFASKGNLPVERKGLKLSFEAPVTRHSAKPDVFYERVLQASPEPRLELFARAEREGFTVWGDEV